MEKKEKKIPNIKYKIDVLEALKEKGYSTYALREKKLFGQSAIHKFRNGELPSWNELDTLCNLLELPIGEIVEHIPKAK